jgi:hypothetical protein
MIFESFLGKMSKRCLSRLEQGIAFCTAILRWISPRTRGVQVYYCLVVMYHVGSKFIDICGKWRKVAKLGGLCRRISGLYLRWLLKLPWNVASCFYLLVCVIFLTFQTFFWIRQTTPLQSRSNRSESLDVFISVCSVHLFQHLVRYPIKSSRPDLLKSGIKRRP